MSGSINVLVKDKETGQQSILTYKAFRDTSYRFELLGQVDDSGNLMESDPNLSPQHQRKQVEKKDAVAADAGGKDDPRFKWRPDALSRDGHPFNPDNVTIANVRSALLEAVNGQIPTESIEYIAPGIPAQVVEGPTPQVVIDAMMVEANKIAEEIAVEHLNTNPNDGSEFHVEPAQVSPVPATAPTEPIKERKKPGPKPKNKQA